MPIRWNPTKWIDDLIDDRMHKAGQSMVGVAKMLAAVDTGLMRSRIYYTYAPDQKLLTLHCDVHYAIYQEFGTYQMPPHPFLRPAMNAAGPAFLTGKLTGVTTQMMVGSSLPKNYKPRTIKSHIRPLISAANKLHNVGVTARSRLSAVHLTRASEPMGPGNRTPVYDLTHTQLNRIRRSWN